MWLLFHYTLFCHLSLTGRVWVDLLWKSPPHSSWLVLDSPVWLFSRLNRTRYCCLWTSQVPLAAAEPHNPSPHYLLSWTKYQSLWNLTCAGKRMIVYFDRVAVFFNMQYFQFLVKTHSVAHISPWRPLQSSSPFQCGYYSVRLSPSCLDAWDYSAIYIELSTFVAESNYVFVTSFLKFF